MQRRVTICKYVATFPRKRRGRVRWVTPSIRNKLSFNFGQRYNVTLWQKNAGIHWIHTNIFLTFLFFLPFCIFEKQILALYVTFLCSCIELFDCMKIQDKMKSMDVLCSQRIRVSTRCRLLFYFFCGHKSWQEVQIYLFQALFHGGDRSVPGSPQW